MNNQFRLLFEGSPFLPQIDIPQAVTDIQRVESLNREPAATISFHLTRVMTAHTMLLRLDNQAINDYRLSFRDIRFLDIGYQYPLQTIIASAICKDLPDEKRDVVFEELLVPTHDFELLLIQEQIRQDLRATCNLLKKDPSGALIFQFLKDYPGLMDEYFLNGMEIAAHIYFGLAQEVAKATGNDAWLNVPYDPTIT